MKRRFVLGAVAMFLLTSMGLTVYFLKPDFSQLFGLDKQQSNTNGSETINEVEDGKVVEENFGIYIVTSEVKKDEIDKTEKTTSVVVNIFDGVKNELVNSMNINSCEVYNPDPVYRLNSMIDVWGVNCADRIVVFDVDQIIAQLDFDDIDFDKELYWQKFVISPSKKLLAYPDKQSNTLSVYNFETKETSKHQFKFTSISNDSEIVSIGVVQFVNDEMIIVFDSVRSGNLGNEALLYNLNTKKSLVIARYSESSLKESVDVSATATDREVGDFLFAPNDLDNNYYYSHSNDTIRVYNPITDIESNIVIATKLNESRCVADYCNRVVDVTADGRFVLLGNGQGVDGSFQSLVLDTTTKDIVYKLEFNSRYIPTFVGNNLTWVDATTEGFNNPIVYKTLNQYNLLSKDTREYGVDKVVGSMVDIVRM